MLQSQTAALPRHKALHPLKPCKNVKQHKLTCRTQEPLVWLNYFLAHLYKSTGRATALPPASALALASVLVSLAASALTKMLKFFVKILKTLYFLNPQRDFVYVWYNYRCWSKILLSPIHLSSIRNFMLKFCFKVLFKISYM